MAEYCKKCAKKYGFRNDEPCFCEGCGKEVDYGKKGIFYKIIKTIKYYLLTN